MYRFYRWMFDLVGFSRSQSNGFIVFLPLLLAVLVSEPLVRACQTSRPPDFSRERAFLDSLSVEGATRPEAPAVTRSFDPNVAGEEELVLQGLARWQARSIIKYRSRGGRFLSKEDFRRVYGMDSALFARLAPRLALPARRPARVWVPREAPRRTAEQQRLWFDLNRADTAVLKKVRGIGDKLSVRIVRYREALGGFVSHDQLTEIYRLDTAVVDRLRQVSFIDTATSVRKLDLNDAGRQELAVHPYFRRQVADAIVAYRFTHGRFQKVEDLRKIKAIDSITFIRIIPYLSVGEVTTQLDQ